MSTTMSKASWKGQLLVVKSNISIPVQGGFKIFEATTTIDPFAIANELAHKAAGRKTRTATAQKRMSVSKVKRMAL
jgi:hypothetical protein